MPPELLWGKVWVLHVARGEAPGGLQQDHSSGGCGGCAVVCVPHHHRPLIVAQVSQAGSVWCREWGEGQTRVSVQPLKRQRQAKMWKFYLKIEKEKWTAKGGPRGKRIAHEEGNWGCRLPWPYVDTQMNNGQRNIFLKASEDAGPNWNWNTNGPEDGLEMWARRNEKKERVLTLCCFVCEKRSLQTELSKIFNKSILYFPAQVHFFLCTVNVIFIIFIYLFKLTVFIETLTTFNRFENNDVTVVFLYFLLDNIYLWNEKQTMQKLFEIFSKEIWCIIK